MTDTTSGGAGTPAPRVLGGRYEVGSLLGRGGMAEVHVAHDTRLGRTVAVKLLRPDLARDPSFQARFRREAQSAAGLNHASIVAVYDTGADTAVEPHGQSVELPWIVMEYVEGHTLRDTLRSGRPLALDEVLSTTEGVLGALEYSHRMGIVHRDIKPANVMLTPAGEVKVMDFGIARAVSDSSATLTQTSAVMGTAQYLSPEQARGEQVDARSDLYSTGCMLYEVLTGRPPFTGDAPVAVAYQHVSEQPKPPSALRPDLSPAVDSVVLMALTKDREHRYQTAGDFADDLRRAVEGRPLRGATVGAVGAGSTQLLGTVPPGPATAATSVVPPVGGAATGTLPRVEDGTPPEEERKRKKWPWVLLALVLLLGGAGAVALVNQGGSDPDPGVTTPATATVPELTGQDQAGATQLLTDAGLTGVFQNAASDTVAEGEVVSSDPASGTAVEVGGTVNVVLSSGPDAVAVPDLAGDTQSEARSKLTAAGLQVGEVSETDEDPTADKGTVVTWSGQGTSVARGTTVDIAIASGQVQVPDLVGKTVDEARAQLNALNLTANVSTDESSDATPGTVTQQSQAEGATVSVNTSIDLQVAPDRPTQSPTSTSTSTATSSPTSTSTSGSGSGDGSGSGSGSGSGDGDTQGLPTGRPTSGPVDPRDTDDVDPAAG